MKKFINKNSVITFILGILLSGISVYAYVTNASEVSYKPQNPAFNVNNVDLALNTLYDRSNNIHDRIDGTHNKVYWGGTWMDKTTTLNLTKGNYYIFFNFTQSWANPGDLNDDVSFANNQVVSIATTGMTCDDITDEGFRRTADAAVSGSNKVKTAIYYAIKKCNVPSSGTASLISDMGSDTINMYLFDFMIDSIKID